MNTLKLILSLMLAPFWFIVVFAAVFLEGVWLAFAKGLNDAADAISSLIGQAVE
jgi:cbb3-type cytochrome oxidase subunit 3